MTLVRLPALILLAFVAGIHPVSKVWAQELTPPRAPDDKMQIPSADSLKAPLSIYESIKMVEHGIHWIESDALDPLTTHTLDLVLRSVEIYLDRIDRARPILDAYTWTRLTREKVLPDDGATQTFSWRRPTRNVSALALEASNGDVMVQSLRVYDANGQAWDFIRERLLPYQQERREFYFLPLPTDVQKIDVTTRRIRPLAGADPRIIIEAGVTQVPESAKHAIYHLRTARLALHPLDRETLLRHMRASVEKMREYQRTRMDLP